MRKMILLVLLFLIIATSGFFFLGFARPAENITWGVNFSQKQAELLGLDWKKTYLAILDDLGAENLKIAVHWDFIEGKEGEYYFDDLDWQLAEAEKREVKVILVVGMKTPRWPECHIPQWLKDKEPEIKNRKLLEYLEKIVSRYKDSPAIWAWQVENEPFFSFGECPTFDKDILKEEVALVRLLDSRKRPIIISESGEFSFWFRAAKIGDIVGTTLYRRIWSKEFKIYYTHFFPAAFYHRKAQIVKAFFNKKVICVELQAEPWGPELIYDLSLAEQEKSMDLERFQKNVEFAQKTGLDAFYFWGAEWWYWLKEKQNKPEIWDEAKKLFQ